MTDIAKEKYINPYTDFGFKKLFGTDINKDLLISFLNALFNNSGKEIEEVQYLNVEQAEIAKYDDIERRQYEASLKEYWDYTSTMDTAHDKGVAEGIRKEKTETIHRLQAMGLTIDQIAIGADMSVDDVNNILTAVINRQ